MQQMEGFINRTFFFFKHLIEIILPKDIVFQEYVLLENPLGSVCIQSKHLKEADRGTHSSIPHPQSKTRNFRQNPSKPQIFQWNNKTNNPAERQKKHNNKETKPESPTGKRQKQGQNFSTYPLGPYMIVCNLQKLL